MKIFSIGVFLWETLNIMQNYSDLKKLWFTQSIKYAAAYNNLTNLQA